MFRAIDSGESPQPGRILAGSFTPPIVVDPLGDGGGGGSTLSPNVIGPLGANRVVELSGDSVNFLIALDSGATIKQTQGGTLGAPTNETPWSVQPRDPAKGAFGVFVTGTLFNTTIDVVMQWGYNCDSSRAGEPEASWHIEQDYEVSPGLHLLEMFNQIADPVTVTSVRPVFHIWGRGEGSLRTIASFRDGTSISGSFNIADGSGYNYTAVTSVAGGILDRNPLAFNPVRTYTNTHANGYSGAYYTNAAGSIQGTLAYYNPLGYFGLGLRGGVTTFQVFNLFGGPPMFSVDSVNGVQLVGAQDFGNGVGVEALGRCTTVPTVAPIASSARYAEGAACVVKLFDPNGVTTTLSVATPVALADATANITIAQGAWRNMAARAGNRVISIDATGAKNGNQLTVSVQDKGAFTVAFVDTASGATILTIPALTQGSALFQFNGTNWTPRLFGGFQ